MNIEIVILMVVGLILNFFFSIGKVGRYIFFVNGLKNLVIVIVDKMNF